MELQDLNQILKNLKAIKNLRYFTETLETYLQLKILNQSIKDKKFINGLINNAGIRQRLNLKKSNLMTLRNI